MPGFEIKKVIAYTERVGGGLAISKRFKSEEDITVRYPEVAFSANRALGPILATIVVCAVVRTDRSSLKSVQ